MKLKNYLETKKLTQAEFGKMIGASQTTVNRYLNGRWPSREAALAIQQATKGRVMPNDFLVVDPPVIQLVPDAVPAPCDVEAENVAA